MDVGALITDLDAVSPVIGVVLMVAITVILAAVVGTLVLGAATPDDRVPSADFQFDYDESNNELTMIHNGGDSFSDANADRVGFTIPGPVSCSGGTSTRWLAQESDGSIDPADTFTFANGAPSPGCDIGSTSLSSGQKFTLIWSQDGRGSPVGEYTIP